MTEDAGNAEAFLAIAGALCALYFLYKGLDGWRRQHVSYRMHEYTGAAAKRVAAVFVLMGAVGLMLAWTIWQRT